MTKKLLAFADESVRASAEPPLYLIAATVVPEGVDLAPLERMLPKGAPKLHWRDLGRKAQRDVLAEIARFHPESTVVIASPLDPKKQERARRKNLEALLPFLESKGVDEVVMESRFPAADTKDRAHFWGYVSKSVSG